MADPLTGYTHSAAFDIGKLPVSDIHTLHYEQYGKQDGKPGKIFLLK
jgi:proline iminopeptidase